MSSPHHVPNQLAEQLLDPTLYLGDPFGLYRELRESAPVAWCESKGFWAVTSHELVSRISTDPEQFCSGRGILVEEIGVVYDNPPTMMHTDPPAHTRYRRLVQPSFKPTAVRELESSIRSTATSLIDQIPTGEDCDIVRTLSIPYPLQVICTLLGADPSKWPLFFEWSEAAIPGAGSLTAEQRSARQLEMWEHLINLAGARRAAPTTDVVSQLALAEIDGDLLSEPELAMFLIQLLVAGNETTRNLISGGLLALAEHPEQYAALKANPSLIPVAVDHTGHLVLAHRHARHLPWRSSHRKRRSSVVDLCRRQSRPCRLRRYGRSARRDERPKSARELWIWNPLLPRSSPGSTRSESCSRRDSRSLRHHRDHRDGEKKSKLYYRWH